MNNILVAGIGSPFGADQLGWQVIDKLQQDSYLRSCLSQRVNLVKLDRPGSRLIEIIQGYDVVILVDAVQSGLTRGQTVILNSDQITDAVNDISSHGFGVAQTIALARAMRQLPDELMLLGLDVGLTPETSFNDDQIEQLGNRVCLCFSELPAHQGIAGQ